MRSMARNWSSSALTTDDRPVFLFRGPKPLELGQALRGVTLLDFHGKRVPDEAFPSCELGSTLPEDVVKGIRAGNYYFAAAVASVPIPGDDAKGKVGRAKIVLQHLVTAKGLSPGSDIRQDELGF